MAPKAAGLRLRENEPPCHLGYKHLAPFPGPGLLNHESLHLVGFNFFSYKQLAYWAQGHLILGSYWHSLTLSWTNHCRNPQGQAQTFWREERGSKTDAENSVLSSPKQGTKERLPGGSVFRTNLTKPKIKARRNFVPLFWIWTILFPGLFLQDPFLGPPYAFCPHLQAPVETVNDKCHLIHMVYA